jgi:hypothetical protein
VTEEQDTKCGGRSLDRDADWTTGTPRLASGSCTPVSNVQSSFARSGVKSNSLERGRICVENASHNHRGCLQTSRFAGIEGPCDLESLHGLY